MNDYMKSLQKHFDRQEHNELDEQIKCARENLRQDLGAESRHRLLRLLDAQNALLVDSTLMSFTAGFKLAGASQGSWRQMASTPSKKKMKNI